MKKIFTTVILFLAFITAQAQTAEPTPEQLKAQATEQTRELAQKIGLNELEYIKVKNYTLQKLIATQEIKQMYSNDPDMRDKKLAAIEEEYNKNLMATLTPKQHLNYVALNTPK
jgi:hypothetical protein